MIKIAKCGCAGQGGSVVFADTPNVTISGTGTTLDPYRIDVEQLHLVVQDTATVNLTLSGDGSETNPYTLKGDFIGTIQPPDWTPAESRTWGGAVSLADVTGPRTIRATLNANVTSVALPTWSSAESGSITLILAQDATGGRTWVMPGTSALGVDVVLSTAPSARDLIVLFWTGIQWVVVPSAMNVS